MVEPTKPNDDVSKGLEAVICDPLKHSWTFWLETPAKWRQAARGRSSIRPIHTFSHVEMFWSLDNNVHHPSKLTRRADLYCFKNHIVPNWEDPICANGGRWTASFQNGSSDNAWMQSLLAMIEEKFDHGDEICGAVVNVRSRYDRISLWTKNADNEAAQVDDRRLDGNAKSRFTA